VATNVPPISASTLRGAVDLSGLVNPRPARPASPGAGGMTATDATFTEALELSNTVPVIVEFYGQGIEPVLGPLVAQYAGRLALVVVDAPTNPQLTQAFQVQQVPTVAAIIGGRPVQLYVGDYPEAEVRQILDQVLALAAEQGVTGSLPPADGAPETPVEEPLPPHHQEAYDAISAGDYATAVAEYGGLDAQLALADLDLSFGDAASAFDLLLDLFPTLDGTDKNTVRTRLLDYFEILGDDPLVAPTRRRLTALLY
jgi:putative thioredoxin